MTYEMGDSPHGRWFAGGRLNVTVNCLDRQLAGRGDQVAFHWEGEPGDRREITYRELHGEVVALAAGLRALGVRAGDRVAIHLGMVPEAVVSMLACARLGAVHCLLFSALPAEALADRLGDLGPKVLITQDGSWRHGVVLPLKAHADEALGAVAGVEHTLVVRRTGIDVSWFEGDRWYHDVTAEGASLDAGAPEVVDADHPLLVTHLANRRGRPIGVVQRSAGMLAYASMLHRRALTSQPDDVFWLPADIGWLAGQSHGVYGPLTAGATSVLFEGMLDTPTHSRAWEIIERYEVNALMATPSVIRSLQRWVDSPPPTDRLASLRHLVTLGEPIDKKTREWLAKEVGGSRVVVRDGWGQTELGGVVTVDPPAEPPLPDPGLAVLDDDDRPVATGSVGELVLTNPWPALFLGVDSERGLAAARHWHRPGCYATGDAARREADGSITFLGRLDPVMKVAGQLVSANEIRDVLEEHPFVEAAEVVSRPDRRSGETVIACVVLSDEVPGISDDALADIARQLRDHVRETLGGLSQPRAVAFLDGLPEDIAPTQVRRGLKVLCSATSTKVFRVSTAQLLAAVAAGHDIT
jgi:acetyl-CoA synthetase